MACHGWAPVSPASPVEPVATATREFPIAQGRTIRTEHPATCRSGTRAETSRRTSTFPPSEETANRAIAPPGVHDGASGDAQRAITLEAAVNLRIRLRCASFIETLEETPREGATSDHEPDVLAMTVNPAATLRRARWYGAWQSRYLLRRTCYSTEPLTSRRGSRTRRELHRTSLVRSQPSDPWVTGMYRLVHAVSQAHIEARPREGCCLQTGDWRARLLESLAVDPTSTIRSRLRNPLGSARSHSRGDVGSLLARRSRCWSPRWARHGHRRPCDARSMLPPKGSAVG